MKPTIPEILPLLKSYAQSPGNGTGGSLHILFDGNLMDTDVKWCIQFAVEHGDVDGVRLAEMVLKMSKTQRKKLCSLFYTLTP